MTDKRIPVTLLTGFLGAGKTTLLNAVLDDASAGRIAVIVNEFGETGLDHDLIERAEDDAILMRSGCLCCSIRGDLSRTIAGLLRRRAPGPLAGLARGGKQATPFDRIVVESTGLADPGPILQTLQDDPALARKTGLDGVVTVADAANGPATLDAQFEAVSQAAMADLIVLSKTDLVAIEQVAEFEARLKTINPGGRILHAVRGDGVPKRLWGLSGLRPDAAAADVPSWMRDPDLAADPLAHLSGLAHSRSAGPVTSPYDACIGTTSIVLDDPIPAEVFDIWLGTLIRLRGPDILRVKGLVFLEGIETPFVFHSVQHVFDPPVPPRDWQGGERGSSIVAIARDISRPVLQRSLDMLRARLTRDAAPFYSNEVSIPWQIGSHQEESNQTATDMHRL